VIDSYAPALRLIEAWLAQWELLNLDDEYSPDRATLESVLVLLEEISDRIAPLARPYRRDPLSGWFPAAHDKDEAGHVLQVASDALARVEHLQVRVRDALESLGHKQSGERAHRLELVAFALLFPTLLAGIFGMNTWLPVSQRHSWGFAEIVVAMIVMTAAGSYLIRYWDRLRAWRHARRGR